MNSKDKLRVFVKALAGQGWTNMDANEQRGKTHITHKWMLPLLKIKDRAAFVDAFTEAAIREGYSDPYPDVVSQTRRHVAAAFDAVAKAVQP